MKKVAYVLIAISAYEWFSPCAAQAASFLSELGVALRTVSKTRLTLPMRTAASVTFARYYSTQPPRAAESETLEDAIQSFRTNGNTEIRAVDETLADSGEEICDAVETLSKIGRKGYPRDLDETLGSWSWRLHDLKEQEVDLSDLGSPINKLEKVLRLFEEKILRRNDGSGPYSSQVLAIKQKIVSQ